MFNFAERKALSKLDPLTQSYERTAALRRAIFEIEKRWSECSLGKMTAKQTKNLNHAIREAFYLAIKDEKE